MKKIVNRVGWKFVFAFLTPVIRIVGFIETLLLIQIFYD